MVAKPIQSTPSQSSYDLIIVGGAIMGSSAAWFLSDNPDFNGSVLVIERDTNYEFCSTAHTNSCIRQQFSTPLNIQISQFGAEFIKNIRTFMGNDERVPELSIHSYGYMYLADTQGFAKVLTENQQIQTSQGAATQLLSQDELRVNYPFYNVEDIVMGSINLVDEGYWDGATVFEWWRRQARERGTEYIENEVVSMTKNSHGSRVESVTLKSGEVINCGQVVNASGPRAAVTAKMAGIELPVEPRKRFTWIFKAEQPLEQALPLTIDPSGVHVRENGGGTYLAGGHPEIDPVVEFTDFSMNQPFWENHVWPVLANRIPQFESIKITSEWAGHYAFNSFDQNAVMGPHNEVENFIFLNGFSGHGLQQSPAMGRGTAEWITYGEYRTLDMSLFGFDRIVQNEPIIEKAII